VPGPPSGGAGTRWADALDAAELAADRLDQGVLNQFASGMARYRQGEIHWLRGEFEGAEQASRDASGRGYEPQPGLALLRLGQGDRATSAAANRRALRETVRRLPRARLLPAFVQIMLAAGEMDDASSASAELDGIAQSQGTTVLRAQAAYAAGSVALAGDDPAGALVLPNGRLAGDPAAHGRGVRALDEHLVPKVILKGG
jgi:hypothetical protein